MFVNRVLRYCEKSLSFVHPSIVAGGSREMNFHFSPYYLLKKSIMLQSHSLTIFHYQIFFLGI